MAKPLGGESAKRLSAAGPWEGDFELRRRDGSIVLVNARTRLVSAAPVPSQIVVLREMSQRTGLERLQGEIQALISHELRNPLTVIHGYAQLLARTRGFDEAAVAMILRQTERLKRISADLLDVALLESGRFELRCEDMDLVALARDSAAQLSLGADPCVLRLDARDPAIRGQWDPVRLGQVLDNLLSNAIKYSPDGGLIDVCVEDLGDVARVSVSDQGVGIEPQALARLFGKFERGELAQICGFEGLGLGLYVAQRLVEAHGGHISIESEAGMGTTVSFALPFTPRTHVYSAPRPSVDRGQVHPA